MNRLMTFDKYRVFETEFAGRPLKVETGKMTQLANGACLVHYGDTTVHVAVTASEKPREGVDFFPLSVDYEEKMYAVGKIPGSYLKREGRPSEKAILTSRVIDRPIRPLFDKSMRNDVSIVCTVMSVDPDCQPEIVAMIGASIAISISDVPWNGPISGCSVGMIDGEYIINPTEEQRKISQMATTVASTSTRIAMIEAGANCVSDDDMYNAIMAGHEANQKIISFIEEIKAEIGKPKFEFASLEPDHDMFTRGQTQVLTIATLGPVSDKQLLDGIDGETEKRYIHHYNFPSYSVGETKPSRGPGRREIGHGALAERALVPVIPSVEEFPYALRLVSEVLSSNGSTSQGSICGSTLALMDAGVPIKAPVAGISCGLITEGDRWMTMVDIQGLEDFFGDMDFKVAGTHDGITAIQMDLKISGLTPEMVKEALAKTHKARNYILDEVMLKAIAEPREELSKYAPKMFTTTIPADKISEVIGKSGKVIKEIQAECEVKVDIEEDGELGQVFVSGIDSDKCKRAIEIINTIAVDPEPGAMYLGKVTRIMDFGAFVEIAPGKEGLVHISQLDVKRTENVTDVVNVGDIIRVKVMEIDDKGRLNLSRRQVLIDVDGLVPENDIDAERAARPRRPHNDRRGGFNRNNRK